MRAVAMLAGIAFVTSALTASGATATTTASGPRTTAIAWADCAFGHEHPPMSPLTAYTLTSDGIVMRTRALSNSFEDVRAESAVIGAKRFRAIAEGIDRSTLFDPPPKPSPGAGGLVGITITDGLRRTLFAVRRDGEWWDWDAYREYTKPQEAAVGPAYAAAFDPKLVWHPAAARANAFAVCQYDAPRDAMTIPRSASTSMWGVSEIVVADCHRGTADSGAPSVYVYRLMPSGNVARTSADDGDSWIARLTHNANIGSKTFADFAARLEKAGLFREHDTGVNVIVKDAPSERISALRDDRRTAWRSDRYSSRRNYSDIISAILEKVSDPGLLWTASLRDDTGRSPYARSDIEPWRLRA
jgi:hypothetical protein